MDYYQEEVDGCSPWQSRQPVNGNLIKNEDFEAEYKELVESHQRLVAAFVSLKNEFEHEKCKHKETLDEKDELNEQIIRKGNKI